MATIVQDLPFWLFKGGFKVSSGTVEWYTSSYGTDFDSSEIASPLKEVVCKRLHVVKQNIVCFFSGGTILPGAGLCLHCMAALGFSATAHIGLRRGLPE